MKRLMLLGGSRYLLPVIEEAHKLGIYVITCDYLPENIAHKYSDEYHNVSIIEKDKVLKLAQDLKIDGIMSFATDPGVTVAAYVAEKLGLPGSPYESVNILQNKDLFREFLKENGFNVPQAKGFQKGDEVYQSVKGYTYPIIVKPVDSAGSKGVTRVDDIDKLEDAIEYALQYSHCNRFIIEEFIEPEGCPTDSDCFSINDELVCASFSCQYYDSAATNPYTPAAFKWPSDIPEDKQLELRNELQRLIKLLHMGTSIYNVEARVAKDNKVYLMEVSPRGGGNRLAEMVKFASGQDLIKASVQAAVGMPIELELSDPVYNGNWGEIILHSNKSGKYKELQVDEEYSKYIVKSDLWIKQGDEIHTFTGANETIGTLVIHCKTQECLANLVDSIYEHISIIVE